MNKHYRMLILLGLSLLIIGCRRDIDINDEIWQMASVEAYMEAHHLTAKYYETYDDILVAITSSDGGYGLVLIKTDPDTDEIKTVEGTIRHDDYLVIGELTYEETRYTAAYIADAVTRDEATTVRVLFDEVDGESGPFKIEKTLGGLGGFVIDQDLATHKSKITSIALLDEKKYEILKIQE